MAPLKEDFDLTDRGWVDLYVKKCESIMEEFTHYVYALQSHCMEERARCEKLSKDYRNLQTEVTKLNNARISTLQTPDERRRSSNNKNNNNTTLNVNVVKTPNSVDADRTTISDGSPAFLNMAMDSEQLQVETTCILSPAQHRSELLSTSEQLTSPDRRATSEEFDGFGRSVFQHNTSPTCKPINGNNENKSALGFLKARGRLGKTFLNDSREPKLRELNYTSSEEDNTNDMSYHKGKLQAKNSDWLGKDRKIKDRKIVAIKRFSTGLEDIQRKRALLSLNKSGERKLKQSRLTQIVPNIKRNETITTSPEDVENAQKLTYSSTTSAASLAAIKQSPFTSINTDSDDIFQFSSDDDDEAHENVDDDQIEKAKGRIKKCDQKPIESTFLEPLPRETDKSESVLAITPTAPPIIYLDESEDYELADEDRLTLRRNIEDNTTKDPNSKDTSTKVNKNKKSKTGVKSANELAAAMLAEWDEEEAENVEDEKQHKPQVKLECETMTLETKARPPQLPLKKVSIKDMFNIDCDECQKYVNFMGENMTLAQIETHLRRCTRHRIVKDCLPVTPPDYWNPLMPSFSDSDPRNKTLLVDPFLKTKRK